LLLFFDEERFTVDELLLFDDLEDLLTEPEFELLPDLFTLEDLLLFDPDERETDPEDLFPELDRFTFPELLLLLDELLDLTLTLGSELLLETPEDLVERILLELLVLLTLLLVRLVKPELPPLLILDERDDLRSYF
jgi:hypothetical protein